MLYYVFLVSSKYYIFVSFWDFKKLSVLSQGKYFVVTDISCSFFQLSLYHHKLSYSGAFYCLTVNNKRRKYRVFCLNLDCYVLGQIPRNMRTSVRVLKETPFTSESVAHTQKSKKLEESLCRLSKVNSSNRQ